ERARELLQPDQPAARHRLRWPLRHRAAPRGRLGGNAMARLPGIARGDAPEDIARVYDGATARFGKLLDPLVVTAHNPDVFRAYVGFEAAFAQAHAVDERLKALAALKSAALIGCPFCVDLGSTEARASG